jgi:hypothetical protein
LLWPNFKIKLGHGPNFKIKLGHGDLILLPDNRPSIGMSYNKITFKIKLGHNDKILLPGNRPTIGMPYYNRSQPYVCRINKCS